MLVFLDDSILSGIADSIRSKLSSQETYTPSEMATAISAIGEGEQTPDIPTLSNPGTVSDMLSGKQLLDQDLNVVTGNIPTITLANPSITINDDGSITATLTYGSGYIASGGTVTGSISNAVRHVYSGSSAPSSSLGVNGDIYLQF